MSFTNLIKMFINPFLTANKPVQSNMVVKGVFTLPGLVIWIKST